LPGARADADKAVRIDPQNLLGFNNRGLIRYHQNDLVGAADDHGRAIRIDPTFVLAWYHRGRTRFYLGDTEGAIADYDEGIRLAPGDSDLYVARANARRSAGDLGGALDDYAAARRLGANGILGNICVTRFRLGQRAAAAQDCALARQTAGPGDDQPFAAQAGVLLLDGDLGGAEAALDEALRRDPRSAYALRLRGLLHSMRGDATQADRDNASAQEIAPWAEKALRDIFGHALFR
jgi:tetratricopeptide (TPR) repeat protein